MWKVVIMEARGAEKEKEAGETVEAEASAEKERQCSTAGRRRR